MKNTPSSQPTADRSVLYEIHELGKDADLSFLRTENADITEERRYIEAVKEKGSAKRRELAEQIRRWNAAQDMDPAKAVEREKTRELLVKLQSEMEPRGGAVAEAVSEFGATRASEAVTTLKVGVNKVGKDLFTDMKDEKIPVGDKIVTGAKYVIGILGITAAVRWLNKKWHDTFGKGWLSHGFKWLSAIGLGMVGAKVVANTTDGLALSDEGPTMETATGAAPSAAPAKGPSAAPVAKELVNSPAGITLDGSNVRFTVNSLNPLALGAPSIVIDGTPFRIKGLSFAEDTASRGMSMKENGDYLEMNGGARLSKSEATRIVQELKRSGDRIVSVANVTTEAPDASGKYVAKTRTLVFERAI